ncbi:DUF2256 domain-containing protein [Alienimonas chondri]|uniref:DUF2256 domain-containing protein n=1 Tax=Alienimonas chondri TaxID=2681879 RepID=UPI0032E3C287
MSKPSNAEPRRPSKGDLPTKTCPVCERPFSWREKWERDWEQVRYCSEACRRASKRTAPAE